MTPRLLDFIFHFPLCLTFTYIFLVLLSGFMLSVSFKKIWIHVFMRAH